MENALGKLFSLFFDEGNDGLERFTPGTEFNCALGNIIDTITTTGHLNKIEEMALNEQSRIITSTIRLMRPNVMDIQRLLQRFVKFSETSVQ